jgi:Flp pilus assembly protein TadD
VDYFAKAKGLHPFPEEAHNNLGLALAQAGELDRATLELTEAVRINPKFARAHDNLGTVLAQRGQLSEALFHFRRAAELDPENPGIQYNLGFALGQAKSFDEAIFHYENALGLKPNYGQAHYGMAVALVEIGRPREAIDHLEKAIDVNPSWPAPAVKMAWILATSPDSTVRNGETAVRMAQWACEATRYQAPMALDALAAGYAEVGRFDQAVLLIEKAIEITRSAGLSEETEGLARRKEVYQSGKPFRDVKAPDERESGFRE